MPRDGSGNYSLPSGNPVSTGAVISSTVHNNTMSDIATALTASLTKDGQTVATADLPMGTQKHTNVGDAAARNQYATAGQVQDNALAVLGSVSGTNTITGSLSPAITTYSAGMAIVVVPAANNTGAVTLSVNGLTALDILKEDGDALAADDLVADVPAYLVLDGAANDWFLINPQSISDGLLSSNVPLLDAANVFTGDPAITIEGAGPQIRLEETDGAADNQNTMITQSGEEFSIRFYLDDYSSFRYVMRVARDGQTVDQITFNVGSGETAMTLVANGAANLFFNNSLAFSTDTTGIDVFDTSGDDPRISLFQDDGTTRGARIQSVGSGSLNIVSEIHGGIVRLRGEDSGGTEQDLVRCSPDGRTTLYYAGSEALASDSGGASIFSPSGDNPILGLYEDDGSTRAGFIQAGPSNGLRIRSEEHGAPLLLEAEDLGGTVRSMFSGDPDGNVHLYYPPDDVIRLSARSGGIGVLCSDGNTDTEIRILRLAHQDGTGRAFVGHNGTTSLILRNQIHGGVTNIEAEDTGGTARALVSGDPDGSVDLYEHEANNQIALTTQRRDGGNSSAAQVRHADNALYDVGLNVIPENNDLDSGNMTLAADNAAKMLTYNTGTGRTLNAPASYAGPDNSAWTVIVGPSAGTLTLDAGAGVVIRYWDGSAWSDTSSGGTVTLGEGQHSIWHDSDTLFYVNGPNIS